MVVLQIAAEGGCISACLNTAPVSPSSQCSPALPLFNLFLYIPHQALSFFFSEEDFFFSHSSISFFKSTLQIATPSSCVSCTKARALLHPAGSFVKSGGGVKSMKTGFYREQIETRSAQFSKNLFTCQPALYIYFVGISCRRRKVSINLTMSVRVNKMDN